MQPRVRVSSRPKSLSGSPFYRRCGQIPARAAIACCAVAAHPASALSSSVGGTRRVLTSTRRPAAGLALPPLHGSPSPIITRGLCPHGHAHYGLRLYRAPSASRARAGRARGARRRGSRPAAAPWVSLAHHHTRPLPPTGTLTSGRESIARALRAARSFETSTRRPAVGLSPCRRSTGPSRGLTPSTCSRAPTVECRQACGERRPPLLRQRRRLALSASLCGVRARAGRDRCCFGKGGSSYPRVRKRLSSWRDDERAATGGGAHALPPLHGRRRRGTPAPSSLLLSRLRPPGSSPGGGLGHPSVWRYPALPGFTARRPG